MCTITQKCDVFRDQGWSYSYTVRLASLGPESSSFETLTMPQRSLWILFWITFAGAKHHLTNTSVTLVGCSLLRLGTDLRYHYKDLIIYWEETRIIWLKVWFLMSFFKVHQSWVPPRWGARGDYWPFSCIYNFFSFVLCHFVYSSWFPIVTPSHLLRPNTSSSVSGVTPHYS